MRRSFAQFMLVLLTMVVGACAGAPSSAPPAYVAGTAPPERDIASEPVH